MYLPKSKYKLKHTSNSSLRDASGGDYRGPYLELSSGRLFTGNSPETIGKEVFTVEEKALLNVDRPFQGYVTPSALDYERGTYIRYFIKDMRTDLIYETTRQSFYDNYERKHLQSGTLLWYLIGPAENTVTDDGNYVIEGTATTNQLAILELNKTLVGLSSFLKDPSEFVK